MEDVVIMVDCKQVDRQAFRETDIIRGFYEKTFRVKKLLQPTMIEIKTCKPPPPLIYTKINLINKSLLTCFRDTLVVLAPWITISLVFNSRRASHPGSIAVPFCSLCSINSFR